MEENIKTHEKKNKKKVIYLILLIFFLIVFAISATILVLKFMPEKSTTPKYKKEITSSQVEGELPENPIDFDALEADNSDVIGWITVDGTAIDNPVLMSSFDKDNDFYINHDLNGNSKKAGALYVQRSNTADFTDFNTVIYGHNMLNGSMFGTLKKYRNKQFFNTNRYMTVYTKGHILKYEVVSAFVYDDRLLYTSFNFNSEEGRQEFIDLIKNPNTMAKNVLDNMDVDTNSKLITLSTCTSVDNERYLVVAKLISDTKTK